jgi:hypothetical protein
MSKKIDLKKIIEKKLNKMLKEESFTGPVPKGEQSLYSTTYPTTNVRITQIVIKYGNEGTKGQPGHGEVIKVPFDGSNYSSAREALNSTELKGKVAKLKKQLSLRVSKMMAMGVSAQKANPALGQGQKSAASARQESKNPIFERYFQDNLSFREKERFEKTPFGQIVADEINYAINNLPEIKLAREVLGNQVAEQSGSKIASKILPAIRDALVQFLPSLIQQEIAKFDEKTGSEIESAIADEIDNIGDTAE